MIEDDGRGGVRADGNGIRGMRERVESLGGRFNVDSDKGTRLTIVVPTEGRPEKTGVGEPQAEPSTVEKAHA